MGGERRNVSIYSVGIPSSESPILCFCTDGEDLSSLGPSLDEAMAQTGTPMVTMIGVHSSNHARANEYLYDPESELFRSHDQLFVHDVPRWLATKFGLDAPRDRRAVFGFSNGGAYALSVGARFPEQYGTVIAFSATRSNVDCLVPAKEAVVLPRYYLAAGQLGPEKLCRKVTSAVARRLRKRGANV